MTNEQLKEIEDRWQAVEISQDFGWYWLSYGEKCYAFACVSALPAHEEDENLVPAPCCLEPHPTDDRLWVTEDGIDMIVDETIVQAERQCGDDLCAFVAHSRQDIGDLIEEVKRLRSKVACLEAHQLREV